MDQKQVNIIILPPHPCAFPFASDIAHQTQCVDANVWLLSFHLENHFSRGVDFLLN